VIVIFLIIDQTTVSLFFKIHLKQPQIKHQIKINVKTKVNKTPNKNQIKYPLANRTKPTKLNYATLN
jgi:hypothetical protein